MESIKCPVPNPIVVLREEFDDRAILFDPDTAKAVGINSVGVSIWKMMNGKIGIEEISLEMREIFTDVPETVSAEISAFIEELHMIGFVGYDLGV
jgi:SynChlorMet cassette protein ScmD